MRNIFEQLAKIKNLWAKLQISKTKTRDQQNYRSAKQKKTVRITNYSLKNKKLNIFNPIMTTVPMHMNNIMQEIITNIHFNTLKQKLI